jgi:protein-tyrosine phosphatase
LIAGKEDPITKPAEAVEIAGFFGLSSAADEDHNERIPLLSGQASQSVSALSTEPGVSPAVSLVVLPSPASHALVYAPLTVRVVSSYIQHFLAQNVTEHLSLGWQLQHMTTSEKWDVKNLAKWAAVDPVSTPIAGLFRAMKTLREVDEQHTPKVFVEQWSRQNGNGKDGEGAIDAVVDISHDSPVYDPAGLERGGIIYRKFPTISKLPPTLDEVRAFFDLIDDLRHELEKGQPENASPYLIAVHCHYGFNRTGTLLVAYLVEKLGWPLQSAIDEFTKHRPPGIRHENFLTELWARYWEWGDERQS